MSLVKTQSLTSYDLLKTFAVVFMVIDHIGSYFFHDVLWFRSVGRIEVPVWFFLVGYSNSRNIPTNLWVGAILLIIGDRIAGRPVFPLNNLVSIIYIRLVIDYVMAFLMRHPVLFWPVNAVMLALFLWPEMACEYGVIGLIMAMFGWVMRRKDQAFAVKGLSVASYGVFSFTAFVATQALIFQFQGPELNFMVAGTGAVMFYLWRFFKPCEFVLPAGGLSRCFARACQFMGRHTLEIYVIHLLMFKITNIFLNKTEFFHFSWG